MPQVTMHAMRVFKSLIIGVTALWCWHAIALTNDTLFSATIIASYPYTDSESTIEATSPETALPCVGGFGQGVWYKFTPDRNGEVVVDTLGSDFDTGLGIYTGFYYAMELITCDDNGAGNSRSKITATLTAGMPYYILAGGFQGESGNLVLHLNFTPTSPAASLEIRMENNTAMLTVTGSEKANYEIQYSEDPEATSWLTVTGLTLSNSPSLVFDPNSTNRAFGFYRTRLVGPVVSTPRIGWVDFVRQPFGEYATILRTNQDPIFDNDVVIAIAAEESVQTHFTYASTGSALEIPNALVGTTPPVYVDGMLFPPPPTIVFPEPDFTVKAVSYQDGRLASSVVKQRFRFKASPPIIGGGGPASILFSSLTINSTIWYTLDGSTPTNSAPSIGPLPNNGSISLTNSNFTIKARAFRNNYSPSEIYFRTYP